VARTEIRIAGFGGQGVILAGVVLGHAAAVHEGKKAVQTQSYGAETRGGAARSEVVVSNEKIDYPKVISADITITMSQESFDRYGAGAKAGSALFVDADLVTNVPAMTPATVYRVPAAKLVAEEFKKTLVANMFMLGAVAAVTKIVKLESLKMSVQEAAPKGSADLNSEALERGFQWANANLGIQPNRYTLASE
jgi:2-oxoglutarate ferredoxin oxidoreductase subunit gamma